MSKVDNELLAKKVVKEYKQFLIETLHSSFPKLSVTEMENAINYSILKRMKNPPAKLVNNYRGGGDVNCTLMNVLDYINACEPIITSFGVLFKRKDESENPLNRMIQGFLEERSRNKAEMFKWLRLKGKKSIEFQKYNLFQLLNKLDANSMYGVLGQCSSVYYNIYVAEAITRQGRSYISQSIMFFESFLADNVKFNSLDEIITFAHNVCLEENDRKFSDAILGSEIPPVEAVFNKLMRNADLTIWVPTEKQMNLLWEYLYALPQYQLNRIYYKNNIYDFSDLPYVYNKLTNVLCTLKNPFTDPNNCPEEIQDQMDELVELYKEFVYYKYPYIDKLDRIEYMQRDVVCISDTDSTIVSYDAWYRYLLGKTYNIDMPIKHMKIKLADYIEADEFGDRPKRVMATKVEPPLDYNFYTDEVVEGERYIEPAVLIPQDGVKFSIINILCYITGKLIVDYLTEYTKLTGSYIEGKPTCMIMKNELYFERALLTPHRRNYANNALLQEGNPIPDGEGLNIMGLTGQPIHYSDIVSKFA